MILCAPQLGIAPDSPLGGAVYDREILRGLAGLGVEVHIPLPSGEAAEDVPGWRLYRCGRHLRYTYEYNALFARRVLALGRRPGYDLLRIHSPSLAPLGGLARTANGRPVVAHYHHIEADRTVQNRLTRAFIRGYALVTTDSAFCVRQLVEGFGVAEERIVVAYPGVAAKYQPQPRDAALRARLGPAERTLLLYLGALEPRKNLRFLLDVFRAARGAGSGAGPGLHLAIAGRGPQEEELRAYAAERGLGRHVTFVGRVDEAQKVGLYNAADLFVFPSRLEGFGMVAAEAMACGVPVVSSNAASLPEVVGDAGLLAGPDDVEGFAAQVARLAQDETLAGELGKRGRARVRALFSWERAAETTLAAYRRVLEGRGRAWR